MISKQLVILSVTVSAATVLGACAKSVQVTTDFPPPLMEPYPLVAGVRYRAELTDFVHTENPELQPEWTIKLGTANLQMFRTLLNGMFIKTIELDVNPQVPVDPAVDFIIEPKLEEMEFSVPQQSGSDQFVVWLRYNLKLLQPDGQLIGDWRITGYGQEDEGDLGMGSGNAMKDAAITALRDAAASIVVGFTKAPGVEEYILTRIDAPDEALAEVTSTGDSVPEDASPGDDEPEDALSKDPLPEDEDEDNLPETHETADDQS
jgi:hypothetical protein